MEDEEMAMKKTARKSAPGAATTRKKAAAKKTTSRTRTQTAPRVVAEGEVYTPIVVRRKIGDRELVLETGRMARQADGAVLATCGETVVLATAESAKAREDIDFFPLTVDYREKAAAAGKFPGGFFKREGRPTSREILTSRIIDRAIRPLFPDGFRKEVQVLSQVFATDQENDSDIVAAIASFAALALSSIPGGKTLGACRIGMKAGELIVNPTWSVTQSAECQLNLTVAAHADAIVMVEAGGDEVPEAKMIEALELAHGVCRDVAEMIDELVEKAGKPKQEFTPPTRNESLDRDIRKKFETLLLEAPCKGADKAERKASMKAAKEQVAAAFPAPDGAAPDEARKHQAYVANVAEEIMKEGERASILAGRRADGRDTRTVRPIQIEVGVIPRVHGSVLFTRGETQTLSVATLGTADDAQMIDGIYPEPHRRFLLHYNFPPFSVGEVKRFGFTGRREIGHGALAERALLPMLPTEAEFPYTLRVTSEILESNGSSSMATVCGATLSLMDAGVPIRQPVAGVAMGLVVEGKKTAILTDILGSEDHCGDMDFKVAGTGRGITALQMDIKCEGLSRQLLEEALEQAKEARLQILRTMLTVMRSPREELSPNAPRLETIKIPVEKIGLVIGPGGRNIRQMQTDYAVRIAVEDDGRVQVAGNDAAKVKAAMKRLEDMTAEVEPGRVYTGRVTSIKEFGAFVEILPGQEGLCHVSELSNEFIRAVTDVVRIGDTIQVKVIGIDDFGKIKLSKRAIDEGGDSAAPRGREREERGDRGDRGERRDRGGRGDRYGRGERGERDDERGPRHGRDRDRDREDRGDRGPRHGRHERWGSDRDRPERDDRGPRHGRDRDRDRERGPDRDREHGRDRDRDPDRGGRGRHRDEREAPREREPRHGGDFDRDRGEERDERPRGDRDDRRQPPRARPAEPQLFEELEGPDDFDTPAATGQAENGGEEEVGAGPEGGRRRRRRRRRN
jgi:polyribonucleotide nucleotidyltransferase